jgi:hypothetical protein
MKTYSTSFIALKNSLEGQVWCDLIDLQINPNTTAFFTSHPDTIDFNGQTYMPIPMRVDVPEVNASGELPQMTVDVSNFKGMALRFARDNDLALNNTTVRLVNVQLTTSGAEDFVQLQILAAIFANETARFVLGYNFNYDVEGPRATWNRRDYPAIPFNPSKFFIFA